jgi:hypothetical protein
MSEEATGRAAQFDLTEEGQCHERSVRHPPPPPLGCGARRGSCPARPRPSGRSAPTANLPELAPSDQGQAGDVLGEDRALERPDPRPLRRLDQGLQEGLADPMTPGRGRHVEADLGDPGVDRPGRDGAQGRPPDECSPGPGHEAAMRQVAAIPRPPVGGVRLEGGVAGGDSLPVDGPDRLPVGRRHGLNGQFHRRTCRSGFPLLHGLLGGSAGHLEFVSIRKDGSTLDERVEHAVGTETKVPFRFLSYLGHAPVATQESTISARSSRCWRRPKP